MTFSFTQAQNDELQALIISTQRAFSDTPSGDGIFTAAYAKVFDFISNEFPIETGSFFLPVEGIPENVFQWVKGAGDVNVSGSTGQPQRYG